MYDSGRPGVTVGYLQPTDIYENIVSLNPGRGFLTLNLGVESDEFVQILPEICLPGKAMVEPFSR